MKNNEPEFAQGEKEYSQALAESKATVTTVDIDNLKPIAHRWVDRGAVMSCEGAGHPNHRSFKIR